MRLNILNSLVLTFRPLGIGTLAPHLTMLDVFRTKMRLPVTSSVALCEVMDFAAGSQRRMRTPTGSDTADIGDIGQRETGSRLSSASGVAVWDAQKIAEMTLSMRMALFIKACAAAARFAKKQKRQE